MLKLKLSFLFGIRGYHEYRVKWVPAPNEALLARQEAHNPNDYYTVIVMKHLLGSLVDSVVYYRPWSKNVV